MTFDVSARVLTEDDCLALLQSREVGRIAFEFEGKVEIFPVDYGMHGRTIVFRTSPGTKLDAAPMGTTVPARWGRTALPTLRPKSECEHRKGSAS